MHLWVMQMLEVHWIVIFTIWPDTGFAGYLKKIQPDTRYFIQFKILNTRMSAKKDQIYSFCRHHILAICEVHIFGERRFSEQFPIWASL